MLLVLAALAPHVLARAQSFSLALFPAALLLLELGRGPDHCSDDDDFGAVVADVLRDEERRVTLAGRGLRRSTEFSFEAMLEQYEEVLTELTSTHARPVASH